jgi:hypothetical protein
MAATAKQMQTALPAERVGLRQAREAAQQGDRKHPKGHTSTQPTKHVHTTHIFWRLL